MTPMRALIAAALPYKHAESGCGLYCDALAPKLRKLGATDFRRVYFHSLGFANDNQLKHHTVLLFRLGADEWVADNQFDWPIHVSGKDTEEKLETYLRRIFRPGSAGIEEEKAL